MVEPVIHVKAVRDDPNDDHVVSCAIAAGAEAIITGDKDLLRMGSYERIKILRPAGVSAARSGQGLNALSVEASCSATLPKISKRSPLTGDF